MAGALGQADPGEHRLGPLQCLAARHPSIAQGQRDVVQRVQPRQQVEALEDEADQAVADRRQSVPVDAEDVVLGEAVGTAVRAVEQAEDIQQGALARARRADDRAAFSGKDVQADVFQYLQRLPQEVALPIPAGRSMIRACLLLAFAPDRSHPFGPPVVPPQGRRYRPNGHTADDGDSAQAATTGNATPRRQRRAKVAAGPPGQCRYSIPPGFAIWRGLSGQAVLSARIGCADH